MTDKAALEQELYHLYVARACGVEFVESTQSLHAQGSCVGVECADSAKALAQTIAHCKLCARSHHQRPHIGYITPNASVIFVVEFPMGDGEMLIDSKGAQMLTKIAHNIFNTQHFSILSLLKCANHQASPQEIELCKPYVIQQIKQANAACVMIFGEMVLESLAQLDSTHKGAVIEVFGKKTIATHSISALLRNPSLKKDALQHFHILRKFLSKQ